MRIDVGALLGLEVKIGMDTLTGVCCDKTTCDGRPLRAMDSKLSSKSVSFIAVAVACSNKTLIT